MMKKGLQIVLLSMCGMLTQAVAEPVMIDPDSMVIKIKQLKQSGQLEDAKKLAIQYMNAYPGDSDFQVLLAAIYNQEQDYVAAEKILTAAHAQYPNDAEINDMLNNVKSKRMARAGVPLPSNTQVSAVSQPAPLVSDATVNVVEKQKSTDALTLQYLKKYPEGVDTQIIAALSFYQNKNYRASEEVLQKIVNNLNELIKIIQQANTDESNAAKKQESNR